MEIVQKVAFDKKLGHMPTAIVIDNGSGICKAGFAGDEDPSITFPNCVGRPWEKLRKQGRSSYIGNEAQVRRGVLTITYPVEHGIIRDWHEIEKLWNHIFKELNVTTSERPVFMTEAPFNPTENRQKIAEVMMETFNVPAIYFGIPGVMALYATGRTTGTILDSGEGVTHSVSVYDGNPLPHTINRMDLAGGELTDYLTKILTERGYSFTTTAEREIIRELKEQLCYVACDYMQQFDIVAKDKTLEKSFELPDGQIITVGNERFRCPEILFQPSLFGVTNLGMHEMIYNSILASHDDLRRELFDNIVLSGGSSVFPGVTERIRKEISVLTHFHIDVGIPEVQNRMSLVWNGSSIFASLPSFPKMWITKQEYEEHGPDILYHKCV